MTYIDTSKVLHHVMIFSAVLMLVIGGTMHIMQKFFGRDS